MIRKPISAFFLLINSSLKIAKFAKSGSNCTGRTGYCNRMPGGLDFRNSLSSGYVSATARPIQSTIGYNTECIQIDASINPGNSGGGLFNMRGQVIGINSSKIAATEYEGMGFANSKQYCCCNSKQPYKSRLYVEGRKQSLE